MVRALQATFARRPSGGQLNGAPKRSPRKDAIRVYLGRLKCEKGDSSLFIYVSLGVRKPF